MSSWERATARLHHSRWGLVALLMVIVIVTRDERGWWLLPLAVVLLAGFWVPGLVALREGPAGVRARRDERLERRRIAAARREIARHRGL
ncbi:MAG TPA: hypothetical protein VM575_20875, partial [Nocardioides sp.]|nr:hypothetical protein [Nocardioides sp.]